MTRRAIAIKEYIFFPILIIVCWADYALFSSLFTDSTPVSYKYYFADICRDNVSHIDSKVFKTKAYQDLYNKNFTKSVTIEISDTLTATRVVFDSLTVFNLGRFVFGDSLTFLNVVKLKIKKNRPSKFIIFDSYFAKRIDFGNITNSEILIDGCNFRDGLGFTDRSEEELSFIENTKKSFKKTIQIENSLLYVRPDFLLVKFDSIVSFKGSTFRLDTLTFYSTSFKYPPDFRDVNLPKNILLSDVSTEKWKTSWDFRSCHFQSDVPGGKQKCTLRLSYSGNTLSSFSGDKFIIPSNLFDIEFGDDIPPHKRITFLEQLSLNCQKEGMITSFEDWNKLYQSYNNTEKWGGLGKVINHLQSLWWDFGYSKWYIVFIWMPIFFTVFWYINYRNLDHITAKIYLDPELGSNFLTSHLPTELINPEQNRLKTLYSIKNSPFGYSFFLTAVIFFGFKIKHEAINYRNTKGILYIYLMYLVGLFTVAYAVGFLIRG